MSRAHYRLAVGGCAISWFLFGLHVPGVLHELTRHWDRLGGGVLVGTLLLFVAGVATVWILLGMPPSPARPSNGASTA